MLCLTAKDLKKAFLEELGRTLVNPHTVRWIEIERADALNPSLCEFDERASGYSYTSILHKEPNRGSSPASPTSTETRTPIAIHARNTSVRAYQNIGTEFLPQRLSVPLLA